MKIRKYLSESPVYALNMAYEAVVSDVHRRLRQEGVNLLQGLVLTALLFEDDPNVTPSQLAEIFATSRGNMSHILSHLESQSWLARRLSLQDARSYTIQLKPEGKKKALRLIKIYDELQDQLEKNLSRSECRRAVVQLTRLKDAYGKTAG